MWRNKNKSRQVVISLRMQVMAPNFRTKQYLTDSLNILYQKCGGSSPFKGGWKLGCWKVCKVVFHFKAGKSECKVLFAHRSYAYQKIYIKMIISVFWHCSNLWNRRRTNEAELCDLVNTDYYFLPQSELSHKVSFAYKF